LEDLAAVEDGQPAGEGLGVGQVVGDQDRRHGLLRHQGAHQGGQAPPQAGVQPGEGLVEQQGVAAGEQQAAQRDPVGLAAGQPRGHRGQQPSDAQRFGQGG
jgi:hypothetical protein